MAAPKDIVKLKKDNCKTAVVQVEPVGLRLLAVVAVNKSFGRNNSMITVVIMLRNLVY